MATIEQKTAIGDYARGSARSEIAMNNDQRCGICKFYLANPQDLRQGFCRIKPPLVFPIPINNALQFISQWPPVQEGQWCGEWKAKLSS